MGGRKKKASSRCKTSKREHKHKPRDKQSHKASFRSPFPSKSRSAIRITSPSPMLSSKMSSLLLRSNRKRRPSPALKSKINRFLFGGKTDGEAQTATESDSAKFDVLKISNLDKRVFNEKLIAKIINKQMSKM